MISCRFLASVGRRFFNLGKVPCKDLIPHSEAWRNEYVIDHGIRVITIVITQKETELVHGDAF
jgi:hypothetical protein